MWKDFRVNFSSSCSWKELKSHLPGDSLPLFWTMGKNLGKRYTPSNHDWKSYPGHYFILFRALETKSYEKWPFGVFFHSHSDFLNMNDTDFSFIGLVKLNIERPIFGNEPLLSQVRKTYEFGLVFGRAIPSVCYHLWTRKNENRHSLIMMGEMGRESFCK